MYHPLRIIKKQFALSSFSVFAMLLTANLAENEPARHAERVFALREACGEVGGEQHGENRKR
jgi:hypothetical protein